MRVLIVTGEYPPRPGGVGDYSARLAAALRDLGHAVTVLTSWTPEPRGQINGAVLRRVRDWGFRAYRPIEAALAASGAEVLHLQYQPGAFQLKGAIHLLPYWLRGRRPAVPVVTTFHDLRVPYLFPKAGPLRPLAVRALLRGSRGAIFVDPADLATAGDGPGRRWVPIGSNIPCAPPRGFERARARRALGAAEHDVLIGYFGFLTATKGAETLLHALRRLLDQGRAVRLALIGAGAGASNPTDRADAAAAHALIAQLGLAPAIHMTGYLAPPEVSAALLACDVVALPFADGASFRRGSLLAALEHGCAIVTTPPKPAARGLPPRVLEAGRQFLAVPPGDPDALAAAIARLVDAPSLAMRLRAEARALAARCSWSSIAGETAELYAAVLAGRGGSS